MGHVYIDGKSVWIKRIGLGKIFRRNFKLFSKWLQGSTNRSQISGSINFQNRQFILVHGPPSDIWEYLSSLRTFGWKILKIWKIFIFFMNGTYCQQRRRFCWLANRSDSWLSGRRPFHHVLSCAASETVDYKNSAARGLCFLLCTTSQSTSDTHCSHRKPSPHCNALENTNNSSSSDRELKKKLYEPRMKSEKLGITSKNHECHDSSLWEMVGSLKAYV